MKQLIFFISLLFSFTIQATQVNKCDESISQLTCDSTPEVGRLLDWAQTEFPDLLQDSYGTFVAHGYLARYYSKHNLYLGSKDREVYGLGDVLGGFVHFGTLDELLESTPKFSNIINTTLLPKNGITITTSLGNAFIHSTGDEPTVIKVDNVVNTNGEPSIHLELSGGEAIIELPEIPEQDITQKSTRLKRQKDNDYPLTEVVDYNFAWFLSVSIGLIPNSNILSIDGISHARLPGNTIIHNPAELNEGVAKHDAKRTEASKLLSVCSKQWVDGSTNCDHENKIPVLFIHGFQPEIKGFNINDNGGEKYWGDFPNIMLTNGYLPFEFKWLTNARFKDVAYDLAKAINIIYTATGKKKVHIVAHSFGGILLRTLLQAEPKSPVTDMIATVTTVGSPHSGIADKQQKMHGMEFPRGQDKDGADLFEACGQLSCHLMGEDIVSTLIGKIFKVDGKPGGWAAKLADMEKSPLPNLNIQVLIGFSLHHEAKSTNSSEVELRTSMGDLLISGYGQRFLPSLALGNDGEHAWPTLLSEEKVGDALVSEFILGRSSANDTQNKFIQTLRPEISLGSYLKSDYLEAGLNLYVPFIHSSRTLDDIKPDYHYSTEVCIGCGKEGSNPEYHDTVQRVLDWMRKKLECDSDETLQYNAEGAAYCKFKEVDNNIPLVTVQPGPTDGKDIWTTSVYSYAPGGGAPGGGLDNEELRVGGWGDYYHSLIQFDLSGLPAIAMSARIELFAYDKKADRYSTGMWLDRISEFWDWRTQGTGSDRERLWWVDHPIAVHWTQDAPQPLPAPALEQWYSIDITNLYNAWQASDNGIDNFGIQLRPVSNNQNNNFFYSSNYIGDPSLRPRLVVVPLLMVN